MAQDFTTTGLLASLKRRGMLPSTTETLSTTDFLAIATEELQTYVWNTLPRTEEYGVTTADVSVSSGTAAYKLPSRAVGGKLRDVWFVDGSSRIDLVRVEPENIGNFGTSGDACGFYLQGDDLVLVPTPNTSRTLRVSFHCRPSALVATSAVAVVQSFNTGTGAITTTATVPATFSTSQTYDIVRAKPPFSILSMDLTASVASGTTVTFSSLPAGLAAGDYVCLAGESPVAQVPVELHPLLSQRVAYKCLEALGDPRAKIAEEAADKMKLEAIKLLTPRVDGAARPIVNYHGPGFRRRR